MGGPSCDGLTLLRGLYLGYLKHFSSYDTQLPLNIRCPDDFKMIITRAKAKTFRPPCCAGRWSLVTSQVAGLRCAGIETIETFLQLIIHHNLARRQRIARSASQLAQPSTGDSAQWKFWAYAQNIIKSIQNMSKKLDKEYLNWAKISPEMIF